MPFSNSSPAVSVTEMNQLTHLGIPLEHITWPRVTMTSNQWLCIRHGMHLERSQTLDRDAVVTILNPHRSLPETYSLRAWSAKMNPDKPLLGVADSSSLRIFCVKTKKLLHRCKIDEDTKFWTWINASMIGIVTKTAVLHWDLSSPPNIMFRILERVWEAQITNYLTDPKLRWLAVCGLYLDEEQVSGIIQLHSVDYKLSQIISAHCSYLTEYVFSSSCEPSTVLVVANRSHFGTSGKLHVLELGPAPKGTLRSYTEPLEFSDPLDRYNFPVSIQVTPKYGLVYMTTKYGILYICDLETATPLYVHTICTDVTFATALSEEALVVVSRNGQVLHIELKKMQFLKHMSAKRPGISARLDKIFRAETDVVTSQPTC